MTQTNDPPTVLDIGLIPNSNEKADLSAPSSSGGKLVVAQVPNISISSTTVVADETERLGLDVQEGDLAIQSDNTTSYIFTGGDNVAANWQEVQFDAVGAINGETISPANVNVSGAINGADTSAAAAGEAITSDGNGNFSFASVGGIEDVSTFANLPTLSPPQLAYVQDEDEYYVSKDTIPRFDISTGSFSGVTLSTQDSLPWGVAFNDDGTKMYENGLTSEKIYQYSLTTAFDISTATFSGVTFSPQPSARDIGFNNDGTKMYNLGGGNIYEYDLSTAFDITTAVYNSVSFGLEANFNTGFAFNDDGSKLYNCSQGEDIYQYSLSTPFDVSTASYNNVSTNPAGPKTRAIQFSNDGKLLIEVDKNTDFAQHSLTTAFDLSTASLTGSTLATDASVPSGLAFSNDGRVLLATDESGIIEEYLLTAPWEAI